MFMKKIRGVASIYMHFLQIAQFLDDPISRLT